jgi:hypothetical protein
MGGVAVVDPDLAREVQDDKDDLTEEEKDELGLEPYFDDMSQDDEGDYPDSQDLFSYFRLEDMQEARDYAGRAKLAALKRGLTEEEAQSVYNEAFAIKAGAISDKKGY